MNKNDIVLSIEGLNKHFGPTHANKNIHFTLKKGEIRGLAGENGSGKSTLASMIAGINRWDSGEIYKGGVKYAPSSPIDAIHQKISIVVQELGLVNNLPPSVNVFVGRTNEFTRLGVVNLGKINKAAREIFKKWELGEMPSMKTVEELPVESKKVIEIARALSTDPDILILDEVTQALSHDKRMMLYKLIEKLKGMGKSLIIISHDLEELIKLTDSITVLRDGEIVDTKESSELTPDILKRMMIGRNISGSYYRDDKTESYDPDVILQVKNLYVSKELEDISFSLHKGEILAICGLSDSGIHLLGKAIFQLEKSSKGKVYLKLKNKVLKNPVQAVKHGVAYVPKDRDGEALMMNASIMDNMCLPSIKNIQEPLGLLKPGKLKKVSYEASKNFDVKCTGIAQVISDLSGGNKQKVNLGRWMIKNPEVLILDSPTRGVDVGVKSYIYDLMKQAKKDGIGMILVSDELPEAMGMADTIIILKSGRIVGTIKRSESFTEESIIEVMI